jgi:hypothetical protein
VSSHPARIRAFAESEGIKAKTDPIDAECQRSVKVYHLRSN